MPDACYDNTLATVWQHGFPDALAQCDALAHVCGALVNWLSQRKADIGLSGTLAAQGVKREDLPRLVAVASAGMCHLTHPRSCTLYTPAIFEPLFEEAPCLLPGA